MIYIALLRGVNVGGHNRIKMADLRDALGNLGLQKVKTYIQSGNILFESDLGEAELCRQIEALIESQFGFSSPVILRTAEELEEITVQCPFSEAKISEAEATAVGEVLHVAVLPQEPSTEGMEKIAKYHTSDEEYVIRGRDVYLLFRTSIRNSKLASNLFRLGAPATVRNWKTMNKLVEMARGMKA